MSPKMAEIDKREAIRGAYRGLDGKPSKSWSAKVDKMSDQQVIAVYLRLKNTNKI